MARAETTVTPDLLRGLEVGSVVEAGLTMPGLSAEKFAFALVSVKPDKTLYEFEVSAFEIFMFTAIAKIAPGEKILWEVTP